MGRKAASRPSRAREPCETHGINLATAPLREVISGELLFTFGVNFPTTPATPDPSQYSGICRAPVLRAVAPGMRCKYARFTSLACGDSAVSRRWCLG